MASASSSSRVPIQGHDAYTTPSSGKANATSSNSPSTVIPAITFRVYPTELDNIEKLWRDRYSFFLQQGLELRPRYHPDWTPSWIGTSINPTYCEDAIQQIIPGVLDAKRLSDGSIVCIKRIQKKTDEVEIAQYLSCGRLKDARNHCVEILGTFNDPLLPDVKYLVMPSLRPFDDPEFGAVGEAVDFVTQILEGLSFMHSHLVAHGDLTGLNIMMDGRPILPGGWHFVDGCFTPDGIDELRPLARIDHPVRYFIIDYDCSVRFRPGESPVIHGLGGRDQDLPELALYQPFDHFKADVFTLGNVFLKDFKQKYLGLDFLDVLIDAMMTREPGQRLTAPASLDLWYRIRSGLSVSMAPWRLRKPDESVSERVINTIVAARDGIHSLGSIFYRNSSQAKGTWPKP
ncbi:hypothetical protein Hypma_004589 [Hypsizygus marmoreus]|uniref:Protein kinase domain-containing protein n=1 Tax=Hypsizygus marmoreus TaxID=39966 RepID=A0A369K3F6_HYPMA|nr:hypothetical protein Hypma_004589 [Hypsizygus marmoreus]